MGILFEFLLGPQDGRTYYSSSRVPDDRAYAMLVWKATRNGTVGQSVVGFNPDLAETLLRNSGGQAIKGLHHHRYVVVGKFSDGIVMHVVLRYTHALLPQEAGV